MDIFIKTYKFFVVKDSVRHHIDLPLTNQDRDINQPPFEKLYRKDAKLIEFVT